MAFRSKHIKLIDKNHLFRIRSLKELTLCVNFNGTRYVVNFVFGTSLTNSIDRESLWMVDINGVVGEKLISNLRDLGRLP